MWRFDKGGSTLKKILLRHSEYHYSHKYKFIDLCICVNYYIWWLCRKYNNYVENIKKELEKKDRPKC